MKTITQLDLFAAPTTPAQPLNIQRDIHYGLWQVRDAWLAWGYECYGEFEHLHGAHIATEAEAIAQAESAIRNHLEKLLTGRKGVL